MQFLFAYVFQFFGFKNKATVKSFQKKYRKFEKKIMVKFRLLEQILISKNRFKPNFEKSQKVKPGLDPNSLRIKARSYWQDMTVIRIFFKKEDKRFEMLNFEQKITQYPLFYTFKIGFKIAHPLNVN